MCPKPAETIEDQLILINSLVESYCRFVISSLLKTYILVRFRLVWKFMISLNSFELCLVMFGCFWMVLDVIGEVWQGSGRFGMVWICLNSF